MSKIGPTPKGYFAISERLDGEFLEELDGKGWQAAASGLFRTLVALQRIDVSGTTGYGGWDAAGNGAHGSWREYLLDVDTDSPQRRTHGWRLRLAAYPEAETVFHRGLSALHAAVYACPETRFVVHADMLNRNVFVSEGQISGLIDWGCAIYGDFLYELAAFSFWSPWYPALASVDFRQSAKRAFAAAGLPVANFDERLRAYELHIGLDHIGYSAFMRRDDAVARVSHRTLEIIGAG